MMRILVTGSSGTIGTVVCQRLLEQNYEVVGIDKNENVWDKEINRLTIRGDLLENATLEEAKGRFNMIIHLAANARVFNLVKDPNLARDNFEMVFKVLEFARKNGIRKVIFASSREVYGNSDKIFHDEDEAHVKTCESPYTASKVGGEALVHRYQQCYGTDFVILRFSNVYGRYDNTDRLVPLFIKRCSEKKDLYVYGKDKLLDFTYIDDTVDGLVACVKRFERIKNQVFNIADGKGTTILEVAQLIREMMSAENKILIKENRTGEVVKFIANISKARRILDYEPKVTIVEGIKRSIQWYKEKLY